MHMDLEKLTGIYIIMQLPAQFLGEKSTKGENLIPVLFSQTA